MTWHSAFGTETGIGRALGGWLLLAALCGGVGCTKIPTAPRAPWAAKEEEAPRPVRLVAIWSDSVYQEPGKTPTRGFGGRLYFYNEKNEPIRVEGSLLVYGFDDTVDQHSAVPSRKFAYTAEQFATHYSESELGPSYSVWIPWDAAGGEEAKIGLVPIFTAAGGHLVAGQQTRHVLRGKKRREEAVARREVPRRAIIPRNNGGVRPAAFEEEPEWGGEQTVQRRMETTTIAVPASLQAKMINSTEVPRAPQANLPAAPATERVRTEPHREPVSGPSSQPWRPALQPRYAHPRSQVPAPTAVPPGHGHMR